jgi:hypothetical protein
MIFSKLNPFLRSLLFAAFCGAAYGILTQMFARFGMKNDKPIPEAFLVMSGAYVFLLPAVIGMVHVFVRSREKPIGYASAIFEPLLPSLLCLFFSVLVHWEGTICLIMALPIMLVLAALGGLIMRLVLNLKNKNMVFATFVFLPIPLSFAEQQIPLPQEKQIVANSIRINASAATVWKKIVRVEKITEPQESLFYSMGFPRPVEAVLSGDGVGKTRLATFERGLQFYETVTDWRENEKLGFTIKADPKMTPITTLDAHVTVGGAFFDVLTGVYEIEKISEREVNLKLHSEHRISTHFNFYARLWSRFLMGEIQSNILKVIKKRAEASG